MDSYISSLDNISKQYYEVKNGGTARGVSKISSNSYFLENGDILVLPRDDGDCRYLYGREGFNFWAYSSGYMTCNDGLFSIFNWASEGQEPKIGFFAGFPGKEDLYDVIPLLPVPVFSGEDALPAERYTVFSASSAFYFTEAKGIRFCIRVFPDAEKALYFTITADNQSNNETRFFVSAFFNPFLKHDMFESGENRWFREVRYLTAEEEGGGPGSFLIRVNEDIDRVASISNYAVITRKISLFGDSRLIGHEETASRYEYVGGSRSSLHTPASLRKGHFAGRRHTCAFTEIGAAGDIMHLSVGSRASIKYDIRINHAANCRDEWEPVETARNFRRASEADDRLRELDIMEKTAAENFKWEFGGSEADIIEAGILNKFFIHLIKQVKFCSLLKGYVQPAPLSLIGIRDVFQALEGLLYLEPGAAGKKMLEALDFVLTDGRCPRQYALPAGDGRLPPMDLRPFIDQGSWVISTAASYLKCTGDKSFLAEMRGYCEIVDENKGTVRRTDLRDSVLEHLLRIVDYLLDKRDFEKTGCIRALYGDWNDALDGLGVGGKPDIPYGSGVSVMASLQVYQNLREMAEILEWADKEKYASRIEYLGITGEKLAESIRQYAIVSDGGEERILHGWGNDRAYLVGSFRDPDGESRHSLTSNAFWVLSGMNDADPGLGETILAAYEKLDSKYGFKTFEPYFAPGTPGVGRIHKLPRGTAENGAVYIHAAAFAVMSLFRMGYPQKAWNQLYKLLPFTHERVSCSPYVMPNSYGYNEELLIDGESMLDWQTGSSNVVFKTFVRYVFGIEPGFDGLWLQPAGGCPFKSFRLQIKIRACNVLLDYKNMEKGHREYYMDNQRQESEYCKAMKIDRLRLSWEQLERPCIHISIID